MQSILHHNSISVFPDLKTSLGPKTRFRQSRIIVIYLMLYVIAAILVLGFPNSQFAAFGHSLVLPGSGFLGGSVQWLDLSVFSLSLCVLAISGFLWFATGNVVLLPLVWTAISIGSGVWQAQKPSAEFGPTITGLAFILGPVLIGLLFAYRYISLKRGQARRTAMNKVLAAEAPKAEMQVKERASELSVDDLQHMRLLLDRALQPVNEFEGFEWMDQFQTAAVRYQIQFISYALSLAQANYMPDFTGYLDQAQSNLKAKQESHRIWKYWQLENIWGNLRKGADPIARDNIMYSGFVGAQLAYARQASPRNTANLDGLDCRHGASEFDYSQDEIMQVLVSQYEHAGFGLLSCEPNWVYPLCNAITATAIRAHDAHAGTQYWNRISGGFREALETEFITPGGQFIPFRSNYTGFAPPQVGGTVMQAFPCFFLNSVLPDIAQRQWQSLKIAMEGKDWRKKLWPADVGNYGFSRASSYAATALAAREMGDDETADMLLEYMEQDCPTVLHGGVAHHSKASLWANANAFMAKTSHKNALRDLVTTTHSGIERGPYLAEVDPSQALVAKAKFEGVALSIVAYPAGLPGTVSMTIAGLVPHAAYDVNSGKSDGFTARADGTQEINHPLSGRTEITIRQVN